MIIIPTEKHIDWRRTPIILIALIGLNIIIFSFYQSGDSLKIDRSVGQYVNDDYLDLEWPAYQKFLTSQGKTEQLNEFQSFYDQGDHYQLAYWLLSDAAFADHFGERREALYPRVRDYYWQQRDELHQQLASVSVVAYGFNSQQFNPLTLITYQFLHGDLLHLVGNMFILAVCGFAVEASIGHGLFLLFYLLAGTAGALLYGAFNTGPSSLVGASGAISGVMAMYLGIFRLRRIEFFYWIFVFAGYFRAPALFILPVYIANELLNYVNQPDSNVAFMAHTGGFVVGAVLVLVTNNLKHPVIDQAYIEEDQEVPAAQKARALIYQYLEKFQFESALAEIERFQSRFGDDFELSRMHIVLSAQLGKPYEDALKRLLNWPSVSQRQLRQLNALWRETPELLAILDDDALAKLGVKFLQLPDRSYAEAICEQLQSREAKSPFFADLATRLANLHSKLGNKNKSASYQAIAERLNQGHWL